MKPGPMSALCDCPDRAHYRGTAACPLTPPDPWSTVPTPAEDIDVGRAVDLVTASATHDRRLHTRRGGIAALEDLAGVLADLQTAERLVHRESIIGPVVFAALPHGLGLSVEVDRSPVSDPA